MRGWLALLRVELRWVRAVLVAAAAWGLAGDRFVEILALWLGRPGLEPLQSPFLGFAPAGGVGHPLQADLSALALAALALLAVRQVFPAEGRRGDAALLALPLTRGQVFAARVSACGVVLLAALLTRHTLAVAQQGLGGVWAPGLTGVALGVFALQAVQSVVFLGLALACATWGRGAWVVAGTGLLLTRALHVDPLRLTMSSAPGWLAAAAVGAVWARCFLPRDQSPLLEILRRLRSGSLGTSLARGASLLTALVGAGLVVSIGFGEESSGVRYPERWVHASTRQYRFRYPARQAAQAHRLIGRADEVHAAVARELGFSGRGPHAVELHDGVPAVDARAVVDLRGPTAFQLAHATCRLLVGARLQRRTARTVATFQDGLSRYVAARATGSDPFWSRFTAAVLHSRRTATLKEVFDRAELLAWRGPEAGPPLAEALLEAVRRERGVGAIGRLIEGLAELPGSPSPGALWTEALARAGLAREPLRLRWMEVLEDEPREDPRAEVALPRLRAVVDVQERPPGWRILVIPDIPIPRGWTVVCRVRRKPPAMHERRSERLRANAVGPDDRGVRAFFLRDRRVFRRSRLSRSPWVQLGLRPLGIPLLAEGIWEDWTAPEGPP